MKQLITTDLIRSLDPCADRLYNYLKFYKDKSFTKGQFMGLKNITQSDKMWVAFRLIPKENIRFAAADMAEIVLPIFEKEYPNDNRPRKAIEAARGNDKEDYSAAANAAYSAAAASTYSAASAYSASAASYSAYSAANAAYSAASAYSTYSAAAYAAAAYSAYSDTEKQIRAIVLKYWRLI